jgi:integrase/recombinase XerD
MPDVVLKPFYHRGAGRIALVFEQDALVTGRVKRVGGVRWSQTHLCWHLPMQEASYAALKAAVKGVAALDLRLLEAYLKKRKAGSAPLPPARTSRVVSVRTQAAQRSASDLSAGNLKALADFVMHLKAKAYSASTLKTYRSEFLQLLKVLKVYPVEDLTPTDLKRYMVWIMESRGVTEATAHSRLNALKFYYEQVLGREKFFCGIPRPKKTLQLPKLLNEVELGKLFGALQNKKHKAVLFTAYSAGLRVSEVVALRLQDIDSQRMQIFVRKAKGKKDRLVNLSPVLLEILRSYLRLYRPSPKVYLFESEQTGTAYPTRTVQQIFALAKARAGIRKEVGIHSLRHSFATHLLDKGTDIRYIKELLGHFNIRTTERYLHVSNRQLTSIVSPLDDLTVCL